MNYKSSVSAIALTLALTGCSWTVYDDLAGESWVESSSAPGNLNSAVYGVAVAAGASTATTGSKFFVAGLRPDGIVQITYDDAGNLTKSGEPISANATNPNALPDNPAMAGDPTGTTGAVGIALTEGNPATGRVIVVDEGEAGPQVSTSIQIGSDTIDTLAFGLTNNPDNPDTSDMIVTQSNIVTITANYADTGLRSSHHCRIDRENGYDSVIGELDSSSGEQEIVIGMGNKSRADAPAEVQILSGAVIAEAKASSENTVQCLTDQAPRRDALSIIDAPGAEPDFGAHVVIADFDGNGTSDLAVSAPKSNAKIYVFMNVDLASGAPATPLEITAPAGSAAFGDGLTAGDFDGDGDDELVVADSMTNVNGKTAAGRAYIYELSGSAFGTPMSLGDAQPEDNQRFARSLTVARFGGSDDLLIVAAQDEVFTFFRTPVPNDTDVRNQ